MFFFGVICLLVGIFAFWKSFQKFYSVSDFKRGSMNTLEQGLGRFQDYFGQILVKDAYFVICYPK